jgi:hypothetical protein
MTWVQALGLLTALTEAEGQSSGEDSVFLTGRTAVEAVGWATTIWNRITHIQFRKP